MTATRSRKEVMAYNKHRKTVNHDDCAFCVIEKDDDQLIEETNGFNVIRNIFAYSLWDGQKVTDHMMITPKRHTDNLAGMKPEEKIEYVDLVAKYELLGYNIYSRAPASNIKSVIHQHTHLIKTEGKSMRFVLLLSKPYFRIVR